MNDPGFLKYRREDPACRPVEERIRDFEEVEIPLDAAALQRQAARCMDCGVPFCHGYGCPVGNLAPEFNALVLRGRWREALDVLLETNPFPEFTGRICPAPCEAACVLGIHDPPVAIRSIERAIIEEGFERGYMAPEPPPVRRRETVAVVGSGPAGLAAAQRLNQAGFRVTVFETAPEPGGILRYGIPRFKLDKRIVARRIERMEAEGVRFECGLAAGEDLSARFLVTRHDAVLLAGGAMKPRDLAVPGRTLRGIHFAMDFLIRQEWLLEGRPDPGPATLSAEGKDVVVIGGGDTGADCVGTCLRQGARSVTQLEILPRPPEERSPETPWPQWPLQRRISSSHAEGCRRVWSVATRSFEDDGTGGVSAVATRTVEWGPSGPREREGTERKYPARLALLAMGFVGPACDGVTESMRLERNDRGFPKTDANGMTSMPGVFVSGDMGRGASLVVRAIADGVKVAAAIRRRLDDQKGMGQA